MSVASFGEYPIVTLMVSDGEFHASLAEDNDPESLIMYNWSMSTRTLAAGHLNDRVSAEAEELVGASTDLRRIAEAVPGADVKAAEATAQLEGTRAVLSFVRALGAPGSIADYLLETLRQLTSQAQKPTTLAAFPTRLVAVLTVCCWSLNPLATRFGKPTIRSQLSVPRSLEPRER